MTITNSETKLFIGAAVATNPDETAFEAISLWTEVTGLSDLGEFGDEAELITEDIIGKGRKVKFKGTRDAGTFDVTVVRDAADAGQGAMRDAEKSRSKFPFKVLLEDGTSFFFAGLVMSHKRTMGGANDVIKITTPIEITSEVFEVEA